MEFFGRQDEIAALRRIRPVALENARMTVLTGRRRVGKTALVRQALDDGRMPYVHLPITRQPEVTLCELPFFWRIVTWRHVSHSHLKGMTGGRGADRGWPCILSCSCRISF